MPEYYSFVTSRIKDKKAVDDICDQLKEWGITDYKVIEAFDTYTIAGVSCEEDCGYPVNLAIIFENNEWEVELVYINYNGEYGYIKNDIEKRRAAVKQ